MDEDIRLVRQVARGDAAASRRFVDAHGRYLYGVAHALAGNPADAEDLVQETLAAAVSGRYRGEASLRTWLVGILVRRAAMLRRSRARRPAEPLVEARTDVPAEPDPTARSDVRLDLTTMLACLSPEHRAVIVLRELQGLTYEAIAGVLKIPRGTVESRLHRARQELRRRFRGYM